MPDEFTPTLSTDEIFRGQDTTRCLSDDLDTIESNLNNKAALNHTHTEYASSDHTHTEYASASHTHTEYAAVNHEHSGYAASDHTHTAADVGAAASNHTHTEYAATNHTHSGYAATNHTHTEYASSDHTHSEYAYASHTHTEYASSSHTHTPSSIGAAAASHTHSGYALSSHTHTPSSIGAAAASHTHDEYFSVDGGTIGGDTNIAGVLRIQGNQAIYFDTTGSSQTFGTNNATGGTTICCGSSADVAINGANVKAPNLIPRGNGNFTLGTTSYRWKGIYSTTAVNVSSDERLKRDITALDNDTLADFIDRLKVVSYNYKTDPDDTHPRIGLIAQDVQKADPEIAKFFVTADEEGMLGLKTADLVYALISTVQNLADRVAVLETAK